MNLAGLSAIVAAFAGVISGIGTMMLSRRAQNMAGRRQEAIDQGPFIEQQRLWQAEIVDWYKERMAEKDRECDHELRELRVRYSEQIKRIEASHIRDLAEQGRILRRAEDLARFWKERALGRPADDATIPPDLQP